MNEQILVQKLKQLNSTQQSINGVSRWCQQYRGDARKITEVWLKALEEAEPSKMVLLFYLCNDIVQTSRKQQEFTSNFFQVIPSALKVVKYCNTSDKSVKAVLRIIAIWRQRQIYGLSAISTFTNALGEDLLLEDISNGKGCQQKHSFDKSHSLDTPQNNNLSIESQINIGKEKWSIVQPFAEHLFSLHDNICRTALLCQSSKMSFKKDYSEYKSQEEMSAAVKDLDNFLQSLQQENDTRKRVVVQLQKLLTKEEQYLQKSIQIYNENTSQKYNLQDHLNKVSNQNSQLDLNHQHAGSNHVKVVNKQVDYQQGQKRSNQSISQDQSKRMKAETSDFVNSVHSDQDQKGYNIQDRQQQKGLEPQGQAKQQDNKQQDINANNAQKLQDKNNSNESDNDVDDRKLQEKIKADQLKESIQSLQSEENMNVTEEQAEMLAQYYEDMSQEEKQKIQDLLDMEGLGEEEDYDPEKDNS